MKRWSLRILRIFLAVVFFALIFHAWTLRPRVSLRPVIDSAYLKYPVHLTPYAGDLNRLVVSEKTGRIKIIDVKQKAVFTLLDLSDRTYLGHLEAGLLSTAFAPDFEQSRHLFVFYALDNPVRARVSRFTVGSDGKADPQSELPILEWEKIEPHHYGGCLLFGDDGYLYVSVGEDVPTSHPLSQRLRGGDIRGSILRIDVSRSSADQPYSVPADNPFVGQPGKLPEIWAYGLRNAWRFHFDRALGKVIVGDTGELTREEYDLLEKGGDYGWPEWEGELCAADSCSDDGEIEPYLSVSHDIARTSIPGFVYEGDRLTSLKGKYVFADFVRGLYAVDKDGISNLITSVYDPAIDVLYYKMPIREGSHVGEKHGIASLHNFGDDEYYVVDMNSTVYTIENVSASDAVFGFLYQFLTF